MLTYGDGKNTNNKGTISYTPKPTASDNHQRAAAAQAARKNSTKIDTKYRTEKGNVYDVYRGADGRYFIIDKNEKISYFTNQNAIAIFNANKKLTTSKSHYENMTESDRKRLEAEVAKNNQTTTNKTTTNSGGNYNTSNGNSSGNTDDSYWRDYAEEMRKKNEELTRIMSAPEAAEKFGIDYNEANILKGYDEASNKKFDELTNAQQTLREQSLRNNAQYIKQTADAYLDSYRNAAPTATGRGALAANMLSNMINATDTLSYNDYGMLQSVNALEQERQKELANNKMLAKDKYTKMGTYLSSLSATQNAANVQAALANMDKYSTEYAASRKTAAANAAAAASRYSGLAKAASINADYAANSALAKWYQYYDMYLRQTNGNTQEADSLIVNNHLTPNGY